MHYQSVLQANCLLRFALVLAVLCCTPTKRNKSVAANFVSIDKDEERAIIMSIADGNDQLVLFSDCAIINEASTCKPIAEGKSIPHFRLVDLVNKDLQELDQEQTQKGYREIRKLKPILSWIRQFLSRQNSPKTADQEDYRRKVFRQLKYPDQNFAVNLDAMKKYLVSLMERAKD